MSETKVQHLLKVWRDSAADYTCSFTEGERELLTECADDLEAALFADATARVPRIHRQLIDAEETGHE